MINMLTMGHINSNNNIKLDVILRKEYIEINKLNKNKQDFILSHKISIPCRDQINFHIQKDKG